MQSRVKLIREINSLNTYLFSIMSNDTNKPNYNLRSKRVRAESPSEGFITASELLYRRQLEEPGDLHETTQPEEAASHEVVSDIPSNRSDEGASERATEEQQSTQQVGDQGVPDSPGDAPRPASPSAHSPVAQQEAEHDRQEVLRLRVQEAWQLHNNEVWVRQCQLSKVGVTVV